VIASAYLAYFLTVGAPVACRPWVPEDGNWGYGRRVAISLNQLVNTLTFGQPDETISSRLGRNRHRSKFARVGCWALDKVDPCHCAGSVELDASGRPQPHQFYLAPVEEQE
jgi:hypothetical protein